VSAPWAVVRSTAPLAAPGGDQWYWSRKRLGEIIFGDRRPTREVRPQVGGEWHRHIGPPVLVECRFTLFWSAVGASGPRDSNERDESGVMRDGTKSRIFDFNTGASRLVVALKHRLQRRLESRTVMANLPLTAANALG